MIGYIWTKPYLGVTYYQKQDSETGWRSSVLSDDWAAVCELENGFCTVDIYRANSNLFANRPSKRTFPNIGEAKAYVEEIFQKEQTHG